VFWKDVISDRFEGVEALVFYDQCSMRKDGLRRWMSRLVNSSESLQFLDMTFDCKLRLSNKQHRSPSSQVTFLEEDGSDMT
jgi:hypothetical protein